MSTSTLQERGRVRGLTADLFAGAATSVQECRTGRNSVDSQRRPIIPPMFVSAIIAAGGRGARLGSAVPKQLLTIGGRTILQRSVEIVDGHQGIDEIVVALPSDLARANPPIVASSRKPIHIVDGGERRQDSVARAFARVSKEADVIVIHDAARPFASRDLFTRVIDAASAGGSAIAALAASDTVKESTTAKGARIVARTIPREAIYLAQTPQAFTRGVLADAIRRGAEHPETATDEASLAEQAGHAVRLVDGEPTNIKITTSADLSVSEALARSLQPESGDVTAAARSALLPLRIGTGYDLHRLEPGRPLIIGGVKIPHATGLAGHSDADVLCHAITDAILGAVAAGDIGQHFPDTDPNWKDADSVALLEGAVQIVGAAGYIVANVDATVIAERPKLLPYVPAIRAKLAKALGVDVSAVSIKGKTNEQVDSLGRNEAIAVHAVALLARRLKPDA
jgi:2-C-methyl-D-erythritol 4-phosphate cytidylyltransferase/2-C-methyl-D-erythritol 2,4-cyclodiphosphate synthase